VTNNIAEFNRVEALKLCHSVNRWRAAATAKQRQYLAFIYYRTTIHGTLPLRQTSAAVFLRDTIRPPSGAGLAPHLIEQSTDDRPMLSSILLMRPWTQHMHRTWRGSRQTLRRVSLRSPLRRAETRHISRFRRVPVRTTASNARYNSSRDSRLEKVCIVDIKRLQPPAAPRVDRGRAAVAEGGGPAKRCSTSFVNSKTVLMFLTGNLGARETPKGSGPTSPFGAWSAPDIATHQAGGRRAGGGAQTLGDNSPEEISK
jgi:hypothetical protein